MTRERQLVQTFVDLADTMVADFDVIEFLHTLASRSVQLLDVDAAGIMLVDPRGSLHAAAASTENARLLELFEMQTDAGPCVDCCRSGLPIVNVGLTGDSDRWPRFADAAQATGFVAVHALPLRLRETVIGALNLFSADSRILTDDDVRTGQALADVATVGILSQRGIAEAELLAAQLQQALTSRVVIEQAKGVLAERRRITVDEAFGLIRDYARDRSLRLSDVARAVADGTFIVTEPVRGPELPN